MFEADAAQFRGARPLNDGARACRPPIHDRPGVLVSHLSNEQLGAYLDGRLDATGRRAVIAHVADCAECRRELIETRRALDTAPRARGGRLRARLTIGAAAAAALAFVALGSWDGARQSTPTDRVRTSGSPEPGRPAGDALPTVAPAMAGVVDRRTLRFVWRRLDGGATYRLVVTDEAGDVRWAASTSDTVVLLPDSVILVSGGTYFWYVDALGGGGTPATSGVRRLTVR
jgi:anti-sigma factor RsiW